MRFGSMPHSAALARTVRIARWTSCISTGWWYLGPRRYFRTTPVHAQRIEPLGDGLALVAGEPAVAAAGADDDRGAVGLLGGRAVDGDRRGRRRLPSPVRRARRPARGGGPAGPAAPAARQRRGRLKQAPRARGASWKRPSNAACHSPSELDARRPTARLELGAGVATARGAVTKSFRLPRRVCRLGSRSRSSSHWSRSARPPAWSSCQSRSRRGRSSSGRRG